MLDVGLSDVPGTKIPRWRPKIAGTSLDDLEWLEIGAELNRGGESRCSSADRGIWGLDGWWYSWGYVKFPRTSKCFLVTAAAERDRGKGKVRGGRLFGRNGGIEARRLSLGLRFREGSLRSQICIDAGLGSSG